MTRTTIALVVAMAWAQVAAAAGVLTLDPQSADVLPDQTVAFELSLAGDDGLDHFVRTAQFDFAGTEGESSSFAFAYASQFCADVGEENCGSSGYSEVGLGTDQPATVWPGLDVDTYMQVLLPETGESIVSATFDFTVPPDALPGTLLTVDVLSPAAVISFNDVTWSAANGLLTGGVATLTVVPEPGSLALLGLGAVAVLRRR